MAIALFLFFVLGWSYYMVASILMRGSIFIGMRLYIDNRVGTCWIFNFLHEMLGCLMCTATEAAIWTLVPTTFVLDIHYRIVSALISGTIGRRIVLPIVAEVVLALLSGIALSFAVSGEAWAIKTIVEHKEEKFLALRDESRARELELLEKIAVLEASALANDEFEFNLD